METLSCPTCANILRDLKKASVGEAAPVPNDIYLCGHCASLSVFSPEGMTLISEEDYHTLEEDYKRDLRFAIRDIISKSKKNLRRTLNVQKFLDEHKN